MKKPKNPFYISIAIIGEQIREVRKYRGWTQSKLAQRVGYYDWTQISKIENGKTNITIRRLSRIMDALSFEMVISISPARTTKKPLNYSQN
jgi:transcriptional regulator with XRE-family HTH domain